MPTASMPLSIGSQPLLLAAMLTGLSHFITRQGGDGLQVLDVAGLSEHSSRRPNDPISLLSYCRALEEAAKATGNANFGLAFGRQFPPQSLGLLGYICLSSPTLGLALASLADYFPLHQQNSRLRLSQRQGICLLEYRTEDAALNRRHPNELMLALLCNVMRQALGAEWQPTAVYFEHPCPGPLEEHRQAFGRGVCFGQEVNAIAFEPRALAEPMPGRDPLLLNVARQSLEMVGELNRVSINFLDLVKNKLVELLSQGNPRLDEVARGLNMPPPLDVAAASGRPWDQLQDPD
ncbi:AraC family transcriptional regulator [Acerihabitans sp. KWT182]|uniref:AraC family transcriptional regulator n=1 Tax=Acerihabitans sp. KWT182 TaxID=3157919 RepID=A0AAU7Q6T7_9GAMM